MRAPRFVQVLVSLIGQIQQNLILWMLMSVWGPEYSLMPRFPNGTHFKWIPAKASWFRVKGPSDCMNAHFGGVSLLASPGGVWLGSRYELLSPKDHER